MFNLCAIVLSITAWKIGILHRCLVIDAFPCKLMFEMSIMCLRNALFIGVLQEATYLWEDDDDRLVALFLKKKTVGCTCLWLSVRLCIQYKLI